MVCTSRLHFEVPALLQVPDGCEKFEIVFPYSARPCTKESCP